LTLIFISLVALKLSYDFLKVKVALSILQGSVGPYAIKYP